MTRPGREIVIESDDGAFDAYLVTPAAGRGPGLVVLQEWWGLVPQIRDVCDRLARAGVEATLRTYPGVQHAFMNDARPDVFDAEAAALAWRDVEAFLLAELS